MLLADIQVSEGHIATAHSFVGKTAEDDKKLQETLAEVLKENEALRAQGHDVSHDYS
jgi:hypothetical protein